MVIVRFPRAVLGPFTRRPKGPPRALITFVAVERWNSPHGCRLIDPDQSKELHRRYRATVVQSLPKARTAATARDANVRANGGRAGRLPPRATDVIRAPPAETGLLFVRPGIHRQYRLCRSCGCSEKPERDSCSVGGLRLKWSQVHI
jgi:hypothetical protein